MKRYFAAALPTVTYLVVQTEAMKEAVVSRYRYADDRVVVIPSGCDMPVHRPPAGLPADRVQIVYVATASPQKNHAFLAHVAAALPRELNARFVLTTTAAEVPDLTRCARELGVLNCFEFLGRIGQDSVRSLYLDSHIAVMPTLLESFGLPYYEAMACGCPVVAYDTSVAREACGDAAIYARTPGAFASSIVDAISEDSWHKRSQASLDRAINVCWPWSRVAEAYALLIENIA